ncbi:hypothetical protein RUM44_009852 [Polyplax serrata]|uniref:Uncharacterized protein n=1 Tax=Polyplax serrata TaxID=468196 RepID=A0ABR1ATV2_POLSC
MIIPQYGNSPLPVVESWLQKDQDDGFVQRDLTSSLTRSDESFGSAHQTYQNSLIRKKKSDNSGNSKQTLGYKKFTGKSDQSRASDFLNDRFIDSDYNAKLAENDAVFNDFGMESDSPSDEYRYKVPFMQNDGNMSPKFFNKIKSDKYMDIVPSKDVMSVNMMGNPALSERNMNGYSEDSGRSAKWSFCKRPKENKYTPNQAIKYMQRDNQENFEGVPLSEESAERRDADLARPYLRRMRLMEEADRKNPQVFSDSEYYDAGANSLGNEEEMTVDDSDDYGQNLNDLTLINKREGGEQQLRVPVMNGFKASYGGGGQPLVDVMKSASTGERQEGPYFDQRNQMDLGNEANPNLKNAMNSDILWKLNTDMQTKALRDVLKNSQRALKEVQFYQQKMNAAALSSGGSQNENDEMKRHARNQPAFGWNNKNFVFDDKRLKREDEDEQKNMKTGTDEGGGGEYEDEEGKGHKDEEEYYEDADLSDEEVPGNEIRTNEDLNQKYVKREITGEASVKSEKREDDENAPSDYELNVDNAPVENAEKSKKTALRSQGEKTKINSDRKGVKIWDQWGKWSPCSVTCGVGRSTRWRHCIGGGCAQGEKEAQIKRCTNPAC